MNRYIKSRTISDNITTLKENEIFVFGSNLAGIHGAGDALPDADVWLTVKDGKFIKVK